MSRLLFPTLKRSVTTAETVYVITVWRHSRWQDLEKIPEDCSKAWFRLQTLRSTTAETYSLEEVKVTRKHRILDHGFITKWKAAKPIDSEGVLSHG